MSFNLKLIYWITHQGHCMVKMVFYGVICGALLNIVTESMKDNGFYYLL